jgi:hypothetical protein
MKRLFNKVICFFSTHRWVDVTFLDNKICHGSTLRYCRRCNREEHKQIEGKYTCIASWRKV